MLNRVKSIILLKRLKARQDSCVTDLKLPDILC
jgi:hypothetical protein